MRAFACLILGATCCGCQPPTAESDLENQRRADVETIKSYRGRDLNGAALQDLQPLWNAFARLCPDVAIDMNAPWLLGPRRIWDFRRADEPERPGYLVLERDLTQQIPGTTHVRLTMLDGTGVPCARTEFTTGHRLHPNSVGLETVPGCAATVLVMESLSLTRVRPDDGVAEFALVRSYFALIDRRFDLIRLEMEDAIEGIVTNLPVVFTSGKPVLGPVPPVQSEEQWVADVLSTDRARVLRALVWLGAHHLRIPPELQQEGNKEQAAHDALAARVRSLPAVAKRLDEFISSGPVWEQEMAESASKRPEFRLR